MKGCSKQLSVLYCLLLFPSVLSSQILTYEGHKPCRTDSMLVYKLPYIAVTDSGEHCIWNFSNFPIDSAELLEIDYYASSPDTGYLGLHREQANLYYRTEQDTLWQTGYETSLTHVKYSRPMALMKYPFEYGDTIRSQYMGEGQYCHLKPISIEGSNTIYADAIGKLVLPEITIDTALRVHSHKRYREIKQMHGYIEESRYYWYSPYCRYPLLETVQIQTITNEDTVPNYSASYYFPQEEASHIRKMKPDSIIDDQMDSIVTDIAYLPNPVYTDIHITYTLIREANVYISLHYNGGTTTYQTPIHHEEEGFHSIQISMAGLQSGAYVVYIHADDTVVSGNLIKL